MSATPDWLEINDRFRIPLSEIEFAISRSSGPGGQNVNKVNSKVQLRWRPLESAAIPEDVRFRILARLESQLTTDGDLLIASQLYRDQPRNREDCLNKLQKLLQTALIVPKTRKKTKPSRASKVRRVREKRIDGEKKIQRRTPRLDE